jgi:hypothetical protein
VDDTRAVGGCVGGSVFLECGGGVFIEHRSEDAMEVDASDFVVVDVDAFEDGLVELTSELRVVAAEVASVSMVEVAERGRGRCEAGREVKARE